MGTVVIALERGFQGDHVVISVNGDVVLDATNVTTDPGSGIAGSVAVDCTDECRIEVALPDSDLKSERRLTVGELTYLRVSLEAGQLVLTPVSEGPRYV
jgi:hypothetical protein